MIILFEILFLCADTVSITGDFQNTFSRVEVGVILYFDKQLLILSDEKVITNKIMNIDVLLMREYRADIYEIQQVFSPEKVLLDARLTNKQKQSLKKQWQQLSVIPIDLGEAVYLERD